ncbi:PP2C family protein-serine/threonine phosphatase [Gracilinema caldarium]|uniref:Protein serine/threonine phosphatase n=1 Tax=Gracilinema caldarium (strain ATCC 51460 / DSM 7334 / H1) TaxID=744872 RepID=F8F3P4_GRAC1|nr:PP2C family protein-serine/threonine phosphatase [Gracilinema caldarium]AEJ19988.1 protein serine/threonine phosphatase [Gracilinema caldarium DSM 7334]
MTAWLITAVYSIRVLAGLFFRYGSFPLLLIAIILMVLQGLSALVLIKLFSKGSSIQKYLRGIELLFWIILSLFFGIDAYVSGASSFSPWALLIIAPIILNPCDPGNYSLYAAVLPSAIGIAEAAGAFSEGRPRYSLFVSIFFAFMLGSIARLRGLKRKAELDKALTLQKDREREIMKIKDAEVEIAARIQRTLLVDQKEEGPKEVELDALTVASSAVDGDFYGIIPYSDSEIDVLVGDVMGKGVPAALVGAALKGAFLRQALRLIVEKQGRLPNPFELVTAVHKAVVDQLMDLDRFATLQYIRFNAVHLTMTYVDCGHTPFIHYDASLGMCWIIQGSNLPIGFTDEQTYYAYTIPLSIGDRILFYSDGISEACNEKKELFGEMRLADIVRMNATLDPRELLRRILNTAMFFASAEGFKDDVTCIAVAIKPMDIFMITKSRDFSCEKQSLEGVRSFINLVLTEAAIQTNRDSITEAVVEGTEAVLQHIESARNAAGSDQLAASEQSGENQAIDSLEALDELEDLPGKKLLPTLMAYRVECRITDAWIHIRILYHGTSLPQKRGKELPLCKNHRPDATYVAKGQDNLAMVGLVFNR